MPNIINMIATLAPVNEGLRNRYSGSIAFFERPSHQKNVVRITPARPSENSTLSCSQPFTPASMIP